MTMAWLLHYIFFIPGLAAKLSSHEEEQGILSAQVITLNNQMARVSWSLSQTQRNRAVEIVYSPAGASYFIVQPVLNPVTDFCILENLLPFTEYELVVRTINNTLDMTMVDRNTFKQSPIMHFSTAVVTDGNSPLHHAPELNLVEVVLVIFMLLLWVVVIKIFLQRWDKLSRLLPYQPVYSKEMAEKIEMEEEKLRSGNSFDICPGGEYSIQPPLLGCINNTLDTMGRARTNSTFLLKQPNSLEVDRSELRKTKSAENMFPAPTIIIDKIGRQDQPSHAQPDQPSLYTPQLLSPSPPPLSSSPNIENNNLLKTPKLNFSLSKFSSGQTAKVCDGKSVDIHNYRGTLFINGRSLDANYSKGTLLINGRSLDANYCKGSPSPTGCRRLSDVSPGMGRTGAGYRQRYRGHTRLGVARLGQSPCLSYQKRSARLVKQRGLSGSGEYMETGENMSH